ncbi:MAG TPA: GreA/GreB family elongation factor [Devosia sp.]|nr:GreA/GreB family elongation factor [Devosia sp.]
MSNAHPIILTPKDFAVLEGLLSAPGESFAGASILIRSKLHAATLVFAEDIKPGVVTIGSRVRFRVDAGRAEECTIVASADEAVAGPTLPLDSPRGIGLIGAHVGQSLRVTRTDGKSETLSVEAVLDQPEARLATAPVLTLVAGSKPEPAAISLNAFRLRRAPTTLGFRDDDDPGPSAA